MAKRTVIPFGPQHPVLPEPVHLDLVVEDETVVAVSYTHLDVYKRQDVFLLISAYVMIFISAMILRKRIPQEELKFKIPGSYGFLCLICLVPCVVAFVAFFINGTDYFIGGMLGIVSGPILYYIWKRMYGGLAKKDPVAYLSLIHICQLLKPPYTRTVRTVV